MKNKQKSSTALIGASMLCFIAGSISWVTLALGSKNHKHLAVPVAPSSALVGAGALIVNALMSPESIQIPDVSEIKVPTVTVQY